MRTSSLFRAVLGLPDRNGKLLGGVPVPRSVSRLKAIAFATENRVCVGIFQAPTKKPAYKVVIWSTWTNAKTRRTNVSTTLFPDQLVTAQRLIEDCRQQLTAQ